MFGLYVSCELTNVTAFGPLDTIEQPFEYTFTVQCNSCHETHDKKISFNRFEIHDLPKSRGSASFIMRCRFCNRESNITMNPKEPILVSESLTPNDKKLVIQFECRGLTPLKFESNGPFTCQSTESRTKFSDIEFESGAWYDYDENGGCEVSIEEVQWYIV